MKNENNIKGYFDVDSEIIKIVNVHMKKKTIIQAEKTETNNSIEKNKDEIML